MNKCKSIIQTNSQGFELLNEIQQLVNENSFLACKKAIDLLNKKVSYLFQEAIQKNNSGKWESSIKEMTFNYSIEELIVYENILRDKISVVRALILANEEKVKFQKQFDDISSSLLITSNKLFDEKKESKETGTAIFIHIGILIVSFILINTQGGILWFLGILGIGFSGFMFFFLLPSFIRASSKSNTFSNKTSENIQSKENINKTIESLESKIRHLENS